MLPGLAVGAGPPLSLIGRDREDGKGLANGLGWCGLVSLEGLHGGRHGRCVDRDRLGGLTDRQNEIDFAALRSSKSDGELLPVEAGSLRFNLIFARS